MNGLQFLWFGEWDIGNDCAAPVSLHQHRDHRVLTLFDESKLIGLRVDVDADEVSEFYLLGRNQVGEREGEVLLDAALQVASAILGVRALFEQEFLREWIAGEDELVRTRRHEHALL